MKYYMFIILAILSVMTGYAQGVYDPENPGDPNPYRKLTLLASPKTGGEVSSNSGSQVGVGQEVTCYASAKTFYEFVHWTKNGEVVSTDTYFSFVMPDEDVELIAVFENNYNPQSPGDPHEIRPSHRVTLTAVPGKGGRFNSSVFKLEEGETTYAYAYPNEGFRFVSWKEDGKIISTTNPLEITMGVNDLAYTATFVYDPQSPGNPGANNFNIYSGELVIDDFEAGYLSSAIRQAVGGYEKYSSIQSITVVGTMDNEDFGFVYGMDNCEMIDLARTAGYNRIPPYAFEGMENLGKIILSSCIDEIGDNAFSGCASLFQISLYATVPPRLNSHSLNGLSNQTIIRVPSSSISLYNANEYWNKYTILPLDEELCSISVALPSDASDGRYKGMTLELANISNGQILKYLITERTGYTFANLVPDTKYSVYVKNSYGSVLGTISDIYLGADNENVTFQNLKQPQNVCIQILTPTGEDVTDITQVSWIDENGTYLAQGARLNGMIEGTHVSYQIGLPSNLALQFQMPERQDFDVKISENIITYNLVPFPNVEISGVVKADSSNTGIRDASVTITQTLNGKYTKSQVVKTDSDGKYSLSIYDAPTSFVFAHNKYLSQTVELENLSDVNSISEVLLKDISGTTINIHLTYQNSAIGGGAVEDYYSDFANVSYRIFNKTSNKDVSSFNVQYPNIIVFDEVSIGDVVSVTASSKKHFFNDVTVEGTVDSENTISLTFPIVQFGGIEAKYLKSENVNNVGILYNANGQLIRTADYVDNKLEINNVPDGNYTLVSLGKSQFYTSVLRLSDMELAGLTQGTDFVTQQISISSGIINAISFEEIPTFDESRFYYTSETTSFTTNKASVTVGNYITLRAKVDFKEEFKTSAEDVKLIFDLPDNCSLVNNSIICGNGLCNYSIEDRKIIVPLTNFDDLVRFCVIPTKSGIYKPTAFIQFSTNGEKVLQPIGDAEFTAETIKLIVPASTVSQETITVSGYAPSNAKVSLYNKNVLVAQTMSSPNGQWALACDVSRGKKYNTNRLYAQVQTDDGQILETETQQIIYNQSSMRVNSVTMVNGSNTIVFDFIDGSHKKNLSYSFNPSITDFTFTVDFDDNNAETLDNVWVNVTTSSGELVELPAYYSNSKEKWVASSKDFDSSSLPVKVSVSYDYFDLSLLNDSELSNDFVEDLYSDIEIKSVITDKQFPEFYVIEYYNEDLGKSDCFTIYKERISNSDYICDLLTDFGWQDISEFENLKHYVKNDEHWVSIVEQNDSISLLSNCNLLEVFNDTNPIINSPNKSPIMRITYVDDYSGYYVLGENIFDRGFRRRMGGVYEKVNCILSCDNTPDDVRFTIAGSARQLWYLNAATIQAALTGIGELGLVFAPGDHILETIVHGTQAAYDQRTIIDAVSGYRDAEIAHIRTIMNTKSECKCPRDNVNNPRNIVSNTLKIISNNKCKKGENEDESDDKLTPTIDPSGYVYEAVPSNRLEGVTATVFYKDYTEDMYGDLHEQIVKWDAEEYAQENPLFTDENGMYAWDVPQGLWQVKFEKNGYETTYSDWLPVPPPQLDVNIGMVQMIQPEVQSVHAYPEAVEILFNKYMRPVSLTTENIIVSVDGNPIDGTIVLLNEEATNKESTETFASKIRFVADVPFSSKEITLTIANRVQSYAGVRMASTYSQSFDIESEITAIEVPDDLDVTYGNTTYVTVSVLPAIAAKGKTIELVNSSDAIAETDSNEYVLNANGQATIAIVGLLPGVTTIKLNVMGYDCHAIMTVNVITGITQTANPAASVLSGIVEKGTEVSLSCPDPNAVIYFTINGGCPCDPNVATIYDGSPIVIDKNMTLKIMALAPGLYESDVIEYQYIVEDAGVTEVSANDNLSLYPLPIKDYLNISNGGLIIESVFIYDMNGNLVAFNEKADSFVTIHVGKLPTGMYLVNILTDGMRITKKVIKR